MENVPNFLFTQGILGIVVLVEGFVILKLYSQIQTLLQRISDLQEARRLDAVETRTDVTSILPGISQALANISDKIEISKGRR